MLLIRPVSEVGRKLVFDQLCREQGFKLTRGGFVRKWDDFKVIDVARKRGGLVVSVSSINLGPGCFVGYFTEYRQRAERARPLAVEVVKLLKEEGIESEIVFVDVRSKLLRVIIAIIILAALIVITLEFMYPISPHAARRDTPTPDSDPTASSSSTRR